MKRNAIIIYALSAASLIVFVLGMCMTFIPAWDAFGKGTIIGTIGIVMGLITFILSRKLNGKKILSLSRHTLAIILISAIGALTLGYGMCLSMIGGRMGLGIVIGITGIVILLLLIPVTRK
ncbi:MAG: hypothetical protein SPF89_03160 [Sphaerochaetaceae bacterium]|nr:hypothetical protein [Spirochaetales bacterium]MDY5499084.1 hypothetical protein [Sphaerochaetaceae bacterium]